MTDYEAAKARLIAHVQRVAAHEWKPAPLRSYARGMATRVDRLRESLWSRECVEFLAYEYGRAMRSESAPKAAELNDPKAYFELLDNMDVLAESARRWADSLPSGLIKPALPDAALGLVAVRRHFGLARPTLYEAGAGVAEFEELCIAAGLILERVTLRNALSSALERFDAEAIPHWLQSVLEGAAP